MRSLRSVGLLVLLASPLVLTGAADASAESASTAFQGGPEHSGVLTGTGLVAPLARAWSRDFGRSASYAVEADGRVFVTVAPPDDSQYATLYALDARTGATLWQQDMHTQMTWSAPAYGSGRVVVSTDDGYLHAYDAATGTLAWTAAPPELEPPSLPIVSGGRAFVGWNGSVLGVDAATGHREWKTAMTAAVNDVAASGSTVFAAQPDRRTDALDAATGAVRWSTPVPNMESGYSVFAAVAGGRLYALNDDWTDPEGSIWDVSDGTRLGGFSSDVAPAVTDREELEVHGGRVDAVDVGDGHVRWSFTSPDGIDIPPLVTDGIAWVENYRGRLYALNADDGSLLWSTAANADPVVGGLGAGAGHLFVPNTHGLEAFAAPAVATPPAAARPAPARPAPAKPAPSTVKPAGAVPARKLHAARLVVAAPARLRWHRGSLKLRLRLRAGQAGTLRIAVHAAGRGQATVLRKTVRFTRAGRRSLTLVVSGRRLRGSVGRHATVAFRMTARGRAPASLSRRVTIVRR